MNADIKKIYDEILQDLVKSEEGKKAWQESETQLTPLLEQWARAQFMLLSGNPSQKEIAKEIIRASVASVDDIKDALQASLNHYLIEKLVAILKEIILKYFLPATLAAI